jgi:glycosyltransferase involved in cell wall biosynthesis/SAM-dependent methyltransferase
VSAPTVCCAGGYDVSYPRTDVILRGCEACGIAVEHRHVRWGSPLQRTWRLRRLLKREPVHSDFVLVPATCHHEVPVVKRCTTVPVVFDPLFSRYLTKIFDYRHASPLSLHAFFNYRIDRKSLAAADYVLADTLAHKRYYCRTFGIPESKVYPLYVGCNTDDFRPVEREPGAVAVAGFYGSFNPLQGADAIVEAARLLKHRRDLRFELAGAGHTHAKALALARKYNLDNVKFLGHVPYRELCARINIWDMCLGIFGPTEKAAMVIPNKVFHYAACGRPVITRDSEAIRELFTHDRDIVLCSTAPADIAGAIEALAGDRARARHIGQAGCDLVRYGYSHVHIGRQFRALLEQWKSDGAGTQQGERGIMKPIKKIPSDRTFEQVKRHYEAEREIAQRLRYAGREERSRIYRTMYSEIFARVPDHPRLHAYRDTVQHDRRNLQKLSLVSRYITADTVFAEFAPGDCAFAYFMCGRVKEVYTYDISDQSMPIDRVPPNFHRIIYDGYTVEGPGATFDIVFSDQLVEHFHPDDVDGHFALVKRLLRDGGRYVLRAPHRYLGPHDISKYFSRTARGFHLCEPTYTHLARTVRKAGFRSCAAHGRIRGKYVRVPLAYFLAVEKVLSGFPRTAQKNLSRPLLPRQLYFMAVK